MKKRKNRRLAWLIVLLSVSLVGVISIQSYWLYNAYTLEQERFERQVGESLQDVVTHLENYESARFLTHQFGVAPFFSERLGYVNEESSDRDSLKEGREGKLKLTMRIGEDTIIVFDNANPDSTLRAYRTNAVGEQNLIWSSRLEELTRKGAQLDFMLRKMVRFQLQRRQDYRMRIDTFLLDSLLRFELGSRGIDLDFEYAVFRGDSLLNQTQAWEREAHQYRALLFDSDFLSEDRLSLSFPQKDRYFFASLWGMLAITLLFTLAIVYTFYRILSFSLRQKRLSEMKTDFINNMTHEFKTPIATISLAIDALNSPRVINDKEKIKHYSQMIRQENRRMNLQVESVLRMALMDRQELNINPRLQPIQQLLERSIEHLSLQLEHRDSKVKRFYNDGGVQVKVDGNHFCSAVINLLDNAIKYSEAAPEISITTELTTSFVLIKVSDRGIGMTAEEQKHIFDRFYRVSAGNLHDVKGHGLGLAYTKGVMEAHGGKIEVSSIKSKGSNFTLYLPRTQE